MGVPLISSRNGWPTSKTDRHLKCPIKTAHPALQVLCMFLAGLRVRSHSSVRDLNKGRCGASDTGPVIRTCLQGKAALLEGGEVDAESWLPS